MKKTMIAGLAMILCMVILLVTSLGGMVFLSYRIDSLTNTIEDISQSARKMQDQLSTMEYELNELKEAADSLLAVENATPGAFDAKTGTVDIHLQLIPKFVTEDMELTVTLGNRKLVLTRYDNMFTGVLKVGLFEDAVPVLTVSSASGSQTQSLEKVTSGFFYTDYLPQVWRNMFGISDASEGKTMLDVGFCFDRSLLPAESGADFETVTIVRHRDGKEELRQDITKYLRETDEDGVSEYTTSFLIGQDEEVLLQVIAVDTYGYVHQMTIRCGADENLEEITWLREETSQICDASGKVLHSDSY